MKEYTYHKNRQVLQYILFIQQWSTSCLSAEESVIILDCTNGNFLGLSFFFFSPASRNNAEWELIAADKTKVPILNAVVPVVLDGKKMMLQSFVDLTRQKEAEKERHENLKELERFYQMAINREEKMIGLKAEVNHLLMQTGQTEKYIVR
jgi:hypothetical protein